MNKMVLALDCDGVTRLGIVVGRTNELCCGTRGYIVELDDGLDVAAFCHKRVFGWRPGMTAEIGFA